MQQWIHCEATLMGIVYWMTDQPQDHDLLTQIPPPDCLWAVEFTEEGLVPFEHEEGNPITQIIAETARFLWGPGA